MSPATDLAVADVLALGPEPDLLEMPLGLELAAKLHAGALAGVYGGTAPADTLRGLRRACRDDPAAHVRVLELLALGALDDVRAVVERHTSAR